MFTLVYSFTKAGSTNSPQDLIGWLGWFLLLMTIVVLLRFTWGYHPRWNKRQAWVLLILILFIIVQGLIFLGFDFISGKAIQSPSITVEVITPLLLIFACLPWIIAGGLLGPAPAVGLGVLSGLFLILFKNQSIFLPLELGFCALLFSIAVRQRYRTFVFQLVRHPLCAALLVGLFYLALFIIDSMFLSPGSLVVRLDNALINVYGVSIIVISSFFVTGFVAELMKIFFPSRWGNQTALKPSPAESRLILRFIGKLLPLSFVLVIILIISSWLIAGQIARAMLKDRMSHAAEMAAQALPFYLSSGQELLTRLSTEPVLYSTDPEQIDSFLAKSTQNSSFFNQLMLVDLKGNLIAGFPKVDLDQDLFPDERAGIILTTNGVIAQNYPIPPRLDSYSARISFLASVIGNGTNLGRVLIGRSDLFQNQVAQVLLSSLNVLSDVNGQGIILDEKKHILFSINPKEVMTVYAGDTAGLSAFYTDVFPEGTSQLVYYQSIESNLWAVVYTLPIQNTRQLTLSIALPVLGLFLILSALALIVVFISLRALIAPIQHLSVEAGQFVNDQFDRALPVGVHDEIGKMQNAMSQMRNTLNSRLDELNHLLVISRGAASALELETAIKPVLDAAGLFGATSARVVLASEMVPEMGEDGNTPTRFGIGPSAELYQAYDDQILSIARTQDRLLLSNLMRPRWLVIPQGDKRPVSLAALALRHENLYYGVFWLAYDETHHFSEEEVRFLETLAGQAAMAASNTRYLLTAEIGRQRLEAILASYPDPVLVTDQQNHLLLGNPAAWQVFGMKVETSKGSAIEKVIDQPEVVNLLKSSSNEQQSAEFTIPEGRVYLAVASTVLIEGRRVGRVCVLRDVTHFKEIDAVKNEFISTVSHDLRSPLSLIRGYTTMLQMVGVLNEQQSGYVKMIVSGANKMTALVDNMLNLGRIEAGIELRLEKVAIVDVIEQVVASLSIQAEQKHISIIKVLPQSQVPIIEAEATLIQQALNNLVENAIKYSEPNTQVQIVLQVLQDEIIVEVRDNGIGIASADQPRLFEKFYRVVKRGTRREDGTGLGLAIVKSIAEKHHGKVWLVSQLGKGSTFYLSLPIRQPKE